MENNQRCIWHEDNNRLQKEKGFITGGCAIQWDIPCGGKPDMVPAPHQCPGPYISHKDINTVNNRADKEVRRSANQIASESALGKIIEVRLY